MRRSDGGDSSVSAAARFYHRVAGFAGERDENWMRPASQMQHIRKPTLAPFTIQEPTLVRIVNFAAGAVLDARPVHAQQSSRMVCCSRKSPLVAESPDGRENARLTIVVKRDESR